MVLSLGIKLVPSLDDRVVDGLVQPPRLLVPGGDAHAEVGRHEARLDRPGYRVALGSGAGGLELREEVRGEMLRHERDVLVRELGHRVEVHAGNLGVIEVGVDGLEDLGGVLGGLEEGLQARLLLRVQPVLDLRVLLLELVLGQIGRSSCTHDDCYLFIVFRV